MSTSILRTALAAALCAAAAALAPAAGAQSGPLALNAAAAVESGTEGGGAGTALEKGRFAVVIDLDENRLYFRQGDLTLWSAPIGTGTGLRMETEDHEFDFSTPNGVFHVKYKELNPNWIAPDWYFIENGLPVPPQGDKKRVFPGGLGAAAVYIDRDLAIHGTDKPELLGQRVSHGCIRLADKDAKRLFHNVQIGTEVVIVGGHRHRSDSTRTVTPEEIQKSKLAASFNPAKPKPAPKDPVLEGWKRMPTEELLMVLGDELWSEEDETRWPEVAALLLGRGLDDDDEALAGLLVAVGDLPSSALEREYATFLADAFSRRSLRTMEVMSQLTGTQRQRAAEAIVSASLLLYPGELDAPNAPWPTSRVPRTVVSVEGRRGWNALSAAEREYRDAGARRQI